MIPILYEENTTEYLTNGIGRLTDAIKCDVKQVTNGIYELSLTYPNDGIHVSELTSNRIIYAKPENGKKPQPFVIRNIDKTLKNHIKVTARHRMYDLSYYPCSEFGQTDVVPYKVTPVLYDSNQEIIGALDELIQYGVAQAGNTWTLTMLYPITGAYAASITTSAYIYAQPAIGRDLHLFDITRVVLPTSATTGNISITATCNVVPDVPREHNKMTVAQALGYIEYYAKQMQDFPYALAVSPVSVDDEWATNLKEFWNESPISVKTLLSNENKRVLNIFGGEWEYDDFTCILHESRGSDNGVQYRYGKNISNISERINIDNLYTHCISFWKGARSSSTNTEQGQYYVKKGSMIRALDNQYQAMFPTQRTYIVDASSEFEDEPTTSQLDAYTRKYIADNKIGVPTVTINVDVVDLATSKDYADIASLELVNLGDTVTVVFPEFGVNIKAKISEIDYDVLKEKNNRVTIGETEVNLSDIIANNKQNLIRSVTNLKVWADNFIELGIEALAGWRGGNIRKNFSATDHKQQSMYIMNSDNVDTASKAIVLDERGLGVSSSGARGAYTYMINLATGVVYFTDSFAGDGDTNATFLKRGRIQDGQSYWDIENKEIYLVLMGLIVNGGVTVNGDITVNGNESISGTLTVGGTDIKATVDSLSNSIGGIGDAFSAVNAALENLNQRVTNLGG